MQDDGYHVGTIELKGWKAIGGLVVILAIIVLCSVNIRGVSTDDQEMIKVIKSYIKARSMGAFSGEIQKHMDSGDMKKASSVGDSVASMRVKIESIEVAYPMIAHFYDKKDVVAKVVYNVSVHGVEGESKSGYFELEYMRMTDSWLCYRDATKLEYYINLGDDD